MTNTDSVFVGHEACPACGSSDALARYSSGWGFCYSCGKKFSPDGSEREPPEGHPVPAKPPRGLLTGEPAAIASRSLSFETCQKFRYWIGQDQKFGTVQIANYTDSSGQNVAQKLRTRDKKFTVVGELKRALPLFGQFLWREGGKRVVITEGEIDALSVSEAQNNRWPVVSIPNGAQGGKKSVKAALEWLESFEHVVICFDNDEPGQAAAAEVAMLFSPGKALIAHLPLKDASDMLTAGRTRELVDCLWNASPYRPDGIVSGTDLWDDVSKTDATAMTISYPWVKLNELTYGMRQGELITLTAGTGIGKSAVCRELAHHLLVGHNQTVGYVALEESTRRTALGLMSIEASLPLHLTREGVTEDRLREAFLKTVGSGRCYLYDHFGSLQVDSLLSKLRYLAVGCGCDWIILDHLSIVVSGLGDGDERQLIDRAMTDIRSLVEATGIGIILVSHLKRPPGTAHEEGGQTSLSQLRGSAAIGQLSDIVIGLERDQQGDNPNHTLLRVLKNRFSGWTGEAGTLVYNRDTGRLSEKGANDSSPAQAAAGGAQEASEFF